MSDLDRQKMREKLQPVLIEGGPGVKAPPCYRWVWFWGVRLPHEAVGCFEAQMPARLQAWL